LACPSSRKTCARARRAASSVIARSQCAPPGSLHHRMTLSVAGTDRDRTEIVDLRDVRARSGST
jgi:hypothetical protein